MLLVYTIFDQPQFCWLIFYHLSIRKRDTDYISDRQLSNDLNIHYNVKNPFFGQDLHSSYCPMLLHHLLGLWPHHVHGRQLAETKSQIMYICVTSLKWNKKSCRFLFSTFKQTALSPNSICTSGILKYCQNGQVLAFLPVMHFSTICLQTSV